MYDLSSVTNCHLELSTRCNAACPLCSRNNSGGSVRAGVVQTELKLKDIQKIFSGKIISQITYFTLCGNAGDPCMASEAHEICEWLLANARSDTQIAVNTNAGMKTPDFWKKMAKLLPKDGGRGHIVFSIDGLEDTNHIYRRHVVWKKVWENLNAFVEQGGEAKWDFLTFRHNQHQIPLVQKICEERGIDLRVKRPLGFDTPEGKERPSRVYDQDGNYVYSIYPPELSGPDIEPEYAGTNIPFPKTTNWNIDLRRYPLNEHEQEKSKACGISCKSLKKYGDEFYISAEGHVLPCCYVGGGVLFPYDYSRAQLIQDVSGATQNWNNVFFHSLENILTSKEMKSIFFDSWSKPSAKEGRLLYCVNHCGTGNKIDLIYHKKFIGNDKYEIFPYHINK